MSTRTVPAGNGIRWLTDALGLLRKNIAAFAMMGLIFAVIGLVPILGQLALALIGPALYAGITWAARVQDEGRNADLPHMFQGFKEPGKTGPLLLLCLPGVVCGAMLLSLVFVMVAAAVAGAGVSVALDSSAAVLATLGLGVVVLALLGVLLGMVVFALTFFAIPDVIFRQSDAMAAMRQSWRACLANFGAVVLFLVALLVPAIVGVALLSFVSQFLLQILVPVVLAPIWGASMYVAWKDVYADLAAELPKLPDDASPGGGMVA